MQRMTHPIHPAIVHFPIVCWTLATLGDFASIWLGEHMWWASGWMLILGTVAAIAAMISGVFELRKVTDDDNVLRVVNTHMQLVLVTWTLYGASLFLRVDNFQQLGAPGSIELTFSGLGLISLFCSGWYGGKLVYENGVGVKKV